MQREKEKVAAKMREKQAAGMIGLEQHEKDIITNGYLADAKKAAEAEAGKK